jgi:hypothetical protein
MITTGIIILAALILIVGFVAVANPVKEIGG